MKKLLSELWNLVINSLFHKKSVFKMPENEYNKKIEEQIAIIKKQAIKLKKYPVSPFFTQKVLNLSRTRQKEDIWLNLQLIPFPVVKFALVTIVIIILFLVIPYNNNNGYYLNNNNHEITTPDTITILYNIDSIENEIESDNQALQFVLLN